MADLELAGSGTLVVFSFRKGWVSTIASCYWSCPWRRLPNRRRGGRKSIDVQKTVSGHGGWRVGVPPGRPVGLLAGKLGRQRRAHLIDVSWQRFWAVPTNLRFVWPPTGKPVIAVLESQIIAVEVLDHVESEGQYL